MIKNRMIVLLAVAATAAALTGGGVAIGAAKTKSPTVCVSKKGGALYSTHTCKKGDHKLTLPAGPKGARGATGKTGLTGKAGKAGASGPSAVPANVTKAVACASTATASGAALVAALAGLPATDADPITITAVLLAPCTYQLAAPLTVPPDVSLIGDGNATVKVHPTLPVSVSATDEIATSGLRLNDVDTLSGLNVIASSEGTLIGTAGVDDDLDNLVVEGLNEEPHPYDGIASTGTLLDGESLNVSGPMSITGADSTLRDVTDGDLQGETITVGGFGTVLDNVTARLDGAPPSGAAAVVTVVSGSVTVIRSDLTAENPIKSRTVADATINAGAPLEVEDSTIGYRENDGGTDAAIVTNSTVDVLRTNFDTDAPAVRGTGASASLLIQQSLLTGAAVVWAGLTPTCEASFRTNTLLSATCT